MASDVRGQSVLVVDDAPENLRLLVAVLARGGFVPRPVPSGRLAIEAAVADPPDLVLLDLCMPGMSGLEICRWFKQDERLRNIPVIFLSGLTGTDDKVEAFRAGGVDYVSKPFQEREVLARIRIHLRLKQVQEELASQNLMLEQQVAAQVKAVTASHMATIFALAKLAEVRDDDTGNHLERVRAFAGLLADQMRAQGSRVVQLTTAFVENLRLTACLHDIGKVGTPDAILLKPGRLTPGEFAEMKKHTLLGADTLAAVLRHYPDNQFLRMGVEVARSHHERWDGSGYPDGLQGEAIPLAARIVAVADFYDALTSKRCYRPAFSHEDTVKMISRGRGTLFDPDVADAFEATADEFRRVRHELQE